MDRNNWQIHPRSENTDMNSTYAPPINNACIPDIYNRLDADVIERTRVVNNQLNVRMLMEQKIISKYRQETERFMRQEKSRVARELARINETLPSFDSSQVVEDNLINTEYQRDRKRRSYQAQRKEGPFCRRCYIHHLPTKKRFYHCNSIAQPLPDVLYSKPKLAPVENHVPKQDVETKSGSNQNIPENEVINDTVHPELDEENFFSQDPSRKLAERLIPVVEAFKFLEREKWGRERDLNHTLNPRLLPNEVWKHVVKNVCNQHSRAHEGTISNFPHPILTEWKSGIKSRRSSAFFDNKPFEIHELSPEKLMRGASRSSSFRRLSVVTKGTGISKVDGKSFIDSSINSGKILAPQKKAQFPKTLLRTNSYFTRSNSNANTNTETEIARDSSHYERQNSIQNVRLHSLAKEG